jgi:UPF0755 protein
MRARPVRAALAAAVLLLPAPAAWLTRELNRPFPGPGGSVIFEVEKGRSGRSVAVSLADKRVVRTSLALRVAFGLYGPAERIKAGEYEFSFPLNAKQALFKLFEGRTYLHPVTVPEGLTGAEMEAVLRDQVPGGAASFRTAFLQTGLISDWDPEARDLEGYLFPDTYRVPKRATAADLVEAMVGQFRRVFDDGRRARAAELGLSVRDAVTLASLIEEETSLDGERALVSAVFHNRLKIGMKLDCDPTVIYALKLEGRYTGRLLLRDLKFPSPYNTYLRAGLPPGPISNPGQPSLHAALHPAPEKFLYFVSRNDGSHRFSRTFAEHLEAVREYRELKKK